jgi:hypothetical protein
MALCIVSYVDTEGLRHTVEVEAESLYEAAALAVKTFKQHDCEPQGLNELEVEMRTSITHTLTVKKAAGANCEACTIRHSVEVQADSLYEAAVLGVRILKEHDCAPGEINKLKA